MDSDAVDTTTGTYRRVTRARGATSIVWFVIAAVSGLVAGLDFDLRLALAVVIVARVSFGTSAGALALLAGAGTTVLAGGHLTSSEPQFASGIWAAVFLVFQSVSMAHLVSVLFDRAVRRERPVRRFLTVAAVVSAASLLSGSIERLVSSSVLDDAVASLWERSAAVAVATLLGAGISAAIRGRWFRYAGMSFDEVTAPLVALAVVVAGVQVTTEVWRADDRDRLRDAARVTVSGFLDDLTSDVNALVVALESDAENLDAFDSVVAVVERGDVGDAVVSGDREVVRAIDSMLSESVVDDGPREPGTRLVGDGPSMVDGRNLLVLEVTLDEATRSDVRYLVIVDADRVLADVSTSLRASFGDVIVGFGASDETPDAVGVVDGVELRFVARPAAGFGVDGERAALVLGFELLLGAAIIAVLLLGASAQVRVALERRRRESLLEAALDATPGLSVVFDHDMYVLAGNRTVRDAFGDRIPGIPVVEVLGFGSETVRARITGELLAKVLGGESGHAEVSGGDGDEMRILELEAYPVPVPGDERLGFLHVSDATERRSLAMRTAQSERMESLGALAGGLAHDFNNLLFVTLGNLQLMAMNETVTKDEKLAKFLSRSMAAVERGAEITKSLLAVARSQPLEETAVSLADLIKGLLPLVKQAVGAGRTVEVDIPDPNLHLMVDAGRLQSCILNLAFNSRDAMGPTGRVRISARRRDDNIELSVSDDGSGMPADVVARAFEPFFTTKKAGSGTGLGLATVYAFAQQSGGTATLESRPGAGTTVTLVLPLHVPGATSERATSVRRAGRRVVVADDEQALAEMVAAWLIDVGVDARFALSPREALELISEFRPDVLVSDANFGVEQDGLDLARLATADQPDLAVIFMTGYSSSMKQLQELGERTLAKPFSREDLYSAVLPLVAESGSAGATSRDERRGGEENG